MPNSWRRARIRASRTRCISPCRPRASARARSGTNPTRIERETPMGFKCGIVGLPNVGKSTLFNALTETAAAQAANYPFCTIEPNVGEVAVPDPRLDVLAKLAKSVEIIPTRLCFVDEDITHVANKIDPIADIDTIETELMLADLESLERRVDALEKKIRGQD